MLLNPLPIIIPPTRGRSLSLQPSILNRNQIRKNTLLVHRHTKQFPAITRAGSEFLARGPHRLPLALEFELLRSSEGGLV